MSTFPTAPVAPKITALKPLSITDLLTFNFRLISGGQMKKLSSLKIDKITFMLITEVDQALRYFNRRDLL